MLLTVATERVRVGDTLITGSEDQPLRRLVVGVTAGPDRVFLECGDCTTPILPAGRLVKVERDEVVAELAAPKGDACAGACQYPSICPPCILADVERNPADAHLIPGTPRAA
jgi:hypothetical protein